MTQLTYLIDEICAGLEIYYTGRNGGQYLKNRFHLVGDYTELTSKLFLLTDNPRWSGNRSKEKDKHHEAAMRSYLAAAHDGKVTSAEVLELLLAGTNTGSFKNYYDVQQDVQAVFNDKRSPQEQERLRKLHAAMKERRQRRNEFFHSTKLLDLSVTPRSCIEAFCDLLDYGELLFGEEWRHEVNATRNLETLEIMLRLEKRNFADPSRINFTVF